RTNAELGGLSIAVRENAAGATELRTRALESQERMTEIIDQTGRATEDAKRGARTVAATTVAADSLAHGLRSLNATAEREAEEARKIGESLRAIEDIVERTHILATNASIEAARAGERGKGFAVIAAEVRTLAASSRESLSTIGGVLRSVAKGIDDSASLVADVSSASANLEEAIAQSRTIFQAIETRVEEIERSIKSFNDVFSHQIESATGAAAAANSAALKINGFEEDYRVRSSDYRTIAASVEETEKGASEAQRAARFLAQLAGYLKVGGNERNRVLQRYEVDQESGDRKYGRKARREILLYNLEVRDPKDVSIGYLGDLSATGLLLLTPKKITVGEKMSIKIVLPLSTEGESTMTFTIRARRLENDIDGFMIGCSFEDLDSSARTRVDYLMRTLTMGAVTQEAPELLEEAETLEEV
ncbi:MAG: methyl-accepting chemotaxis protein, partial [Treponemataceae bacterium]